MEQLPPPLPESGSIVHVPPRPSATITEPVGVPMGACTDTVYVIGPVAPGFADGVTDTDGLCENSGMCAAGGGVIMTLVPGWAIAPFDAFTRKSPLKNWMPPPQHNA